MRLPRIRPLALRPGRGALLRRSTLAAMLSTAAVLFFPVVLWAHARLTRSEPAAGARLVWPPVVIRLWFSEAPELGLSRITLEDSAGHAVRMAGVERDSTRLAIRARIEHPLDVGRYTVRWRAAGVDGHPSEGSFQFVVLPRPDSTGARVPPDSLGVFRTDIAVTQHAVGDALSPPYVLVRTVLFGALLVVIGAVAFQLAILPRVASLETTVAARIRARAARAGAWAAWVLVLAVLGRLVMQSLLVNGPRAFEHLPLVHLTMHTQWGRTWIAQFAAALLAYVGLRNSARGSPSGSGLAVAAVIALAATPALSGHAIGNEQLRWLAVGSDAIHVLSAGGWLGSLLLVLIAGLPVIIRSAGDQRWRDASALINAFSPVGLLLGGAVILTGVINASFELGRLSALWTTGYGRNLLLKLGLFLVLAAVAAVNWLRMRPALGTEIATKRLQRSARLELILAFLVVLITAILVATPTPTPTPTPTVGV